MHAHSFFLLVRGTICTMCTPSKVKNCSRNGLVVMSAKPKSIITRKTCQQSLPIHILSQLVVHMSRKLCTLHRCGYDG